MKLKFILDEQKKFRNKEEERKYYDELADTDIQLYRKTVIGQISDNILVYTTWLLVFKFWCTIFLVSLIKYLIRDNIEASIISGSCLLISIIIITVFNKKINNNGKALLLINNLLDSKNLYNG